MSDLVVGVDSSTTSLKAIAFDRNGHEVFQARGAYPLSTPHPGHVEQDPEDWWRALVSALKSVADAVGGERIAALSIAHQRETFTLLDEAGKALNPGILWLDERARPQVATLSAALGRDTIREWSGKPPDPTPGLYAMAWLAEHKPDILQRAVSLVDVHAFHVQRLTGRLVTSTASADPLGILDTSSGTWRPELVEAAGLRMEQLPELEPPGAILGLLLENVARQTGLRPGIPVVAGAGDGQAMGLGMGVTGPGRGYLSLGSGVVSGTNTGTYVTSDAFRTLTGPSGGYMLETVLRSGMQLVDWVVRTTGSSSVVALEAQSAKLRPGADNLLLMPYWSGVMSPYWDEAARGAILGLSLDHTQAHLHRAALEGIGYEQAIATEAMEGALGSRIDGFTVAGGGTQSPLLLEIMASVLDRPLAVSPVNEAAALGAGMLAAAALGWHASIAAASEAMAEAPTRRIAPNAKLAETYRPRLAIYRDLYAATAGIHRRLMDLG